MKTRIRGVHHKKELLCEIQTPIVKTYKDIRSAESLFNDKADFLKAIERGLEVELMNRARIPFLIARYKAKQVPW